MACSTVWVSNGAPPAANAALILSLPLTGDRYVGVAWDRHHCRRGARPDLRHVHQQDGVGAAVADVAAGGQVLLLFGRQTLAAVRADEQPVRPAAGCGTVGIVRQRRLAVQATCRAKRPRRGCRRRRAQNESAELSASARPQRRLPRLRRVCGAAGRGGAALVVGIAGGVRRSGTAWPAPGGRPPGCTANHLRGLWTRLPRRDRPRLPSTAG